MGERWYYKNNEGSVQGPFGNEEMRAWFVAGYLRQDLLITIDPQRGFNPLKDWFPNLNNSFLPGAAGNPGRKESVQSAGADDEDDLKWYFLDKNRQVQGPFSGVQMYQWFQQGYFEETLQIYDASKPETQWGWKMLREYFPDTDMAFQAGRKAQPAQGTGGNDVISRFQFPEWLPTPPPYRGVKKVYPSEKKQGN